jgi:hypothetical protein
MLLPALILFPVPQVAAAAAPRLIVATTATQKGNDGNLPSIIVGNIIDMTRNESIVA